MKNYEIKGNGLFVYMPEKQKLVKVAEGEIKVDNEILISVKSKGVQTLYLDTTLGLVCGPKNVNEFRWVGGVITFRRQSTWSCGGFTDEEQRLGTDYEEMSGVYRKSHGELSVIVKSQYSSVAIPFVERWAATAEPQTIKYKNLMKADSLLLIENHDGLFTVLEPYYNAVKYSKSSFVQYSNGDEKAVVLALLNGAYHKIYEGENIHGLKNVIIRRDGDKIQMLKYNGLCSSQKPEVIAEGSRSCLIGVLDEVPGRLDQILKIDDKEWWVTNGYLDKVKFDPNAEAEKQQPEKWSLWRWLGINRYSKP